MRATAWAAAPRTMDAFLRQRQASWAAASAIVTGNEAADLDSLACALAYARLSTDAAWVPVLQTRRADLRLRADNLLMLRHLGVDPAHMCCVDDVHVQDGARVVLVDHNRATGPFTTAAVVGVLDHHADEGQHTGASLREMYKPSDAGSCASVVTHHFRGADIPRDVADLLYSAVLIDTLNFDARAGKAQALDMAARDRLAPLSSWPTEAAAARHFQALSEARNDTSHLTPAEKLHRDYKQFGAAGAWVWGASSTTEPLAVLCTPDGFEAMRVWSDERRLDVLLVLAGYEADGQTRRELLLYIPPGRPSSSAQLPELLAAHREHQVDLVPLALPQRPRDGVATAWEQRDVRATRKQFVPAMQAVCAQVPRL